MEKSFNYISGKFLLVEFSSELLPHEIDIHKSLDCRHYFLPHTKVSPWGTAKMQWQHLMCVSKSRGYKKFGAFPVDIKFRAIENFATLLTPFWLELERAWARARRPGHESWARTGTNTYPVQNNEKSSSPKNITWAVYIVGLKSTFRF